MRNRIIEIADDLTDAQEILAIAKQLSRKVLSGSHKRRIGNALIIKRTEETITVRRVSKQAPEQVLTCACGCQYARSAGKAYYTNYGGTVRKLTVCSVECRDQCLQMFGDRVALTKKGLIPTTVYR